jgi:hypothetical protein
MLPMVMLLPLLALLVWFTRGSPVAAFVYAIF